MGHGPLLLRRPPRDLVVRRLEYVRTVAAAGLARLALRVVDAFSDAAAAAYRASKSPKKNQFMLAKQQLIIT